MKKMRRLSVTPQSAPNSEINVTPLVDVVLVLLLVFMVTAPMMSRSIDVALPVANQPQENRPDPITVSVDAGGRVYLMDKLMTLPMLEDRLKSVMAGMTSKVVYLRADSSLKYGKVIEVVDTIKRGGAETVGFVYVLPGEAGPRK